MLTCSELFVNQTLYDKKFRISSLAIWKHFTQPRQKCLKLHALQSLICKKWRNDRRLQHFFTQMSGLLLFLYIQFSQLVLHRKSKLSSLRTSQKHEKRILFSKKFTLSRDGFPSVLCKPQNEHRGQNFAASTKPASSLSKAELRTRIFPIISQL